MNVRNMVSDLLKSVVVLLKPGHFIMLHHVFHISGPSATSLIVIVFRIIWVKCLWISCYLRTINRFTNFDIDSLLLSDRCPHMDLNAVFNNFIWAVCFWFLFAAIGMDIRTFFPWFLLHNFTIFNHLLMTLLIFFIKMKWFTFFCTFIIFYNSVFGIWWAFPNLASIKLYYPF